MIKVFIQPEWIRFATQFAQDSLASRSKKIASRGQTTVEKIKKDITTGTIAEFGVQKYLQLIGVSVSSPDINVYKAKDKRWGSDLSGSGLNIHVKTFTNPRWSSWVFTYNPTRNDIDPVVIAPSPNDVLALTQVTDTHVLLHFLVAAEDVINLYRPPLLPQLKFSKVVLYPADLSKAVNFLTTL